jgi:hypothetical protein
MAEEGLPQSVLQKPLDENNCISREILIHYFPDALGLKYKTAESDTYRR